MSDDAVTRFDVPLLDDSSAIGVIRDAVREQRPFSMIRVNDGEAVALAFGAQMWLDDVSYLRSHWGGEFVTIEAIEEVRDDLWDAIAGADLVGVRPDIVGVPMPADLTQRRGDDVRAFVRDSLPLRPHERDVLTVPSARRIALLQQALAPYEPVDQLWCSCWLHWELLAAGVLDDMLGEVERVGIVTPRAELATVIGQRFDIEVDVVVVPDKFVEANAAGAHVPNFYRTMPDRLNFSPGTLVLVGAGIPGKAYCNWLKQRGCVAVDIGAVFDAWVGKASRPRVLESRFGIAGGGSVPRELMMSADVVAQDRGLMPKWKPSRTRS